MKKSIFAIFAHPDDEAFGPSGTLLSEEKAGNDIHLILLTSGDAGMNPDQHEDLGKVRLSEWQAAAKLIGATSTTFLGYEDGKLCNQAMVEIGEKIINTIDETIGSQQINGTIELLSNDLNGITGHIDHIIAARAACYAFYRLKASDTRITTH